LAWQTNDCLLNAGVKQARRMSQTGFTHLPLANTSDRKFHIIATARQSTQNTNETLSPSERRPAKLLMLAIQRRPANAGPNTIGTGVK
ncbi:hypothetical protein, partial [Rhodopirellula bahusiensis]|uniref:hypothetical protein n=1 Tax=Rhodopirellula bahusiensis TaxID=2014065 RepID=UPI0032648BBE